MILLFPFRVHCTVLSVVALLHLSTATAPSQSASHIVISEIYGGGGNSGALYTHDFIELYNPTTADVIMSGWSVQYQGGGSSGTFASVVKFSGIIRSHGFFLIQANPGSGGTVPLPSPDAVAGFSMAATSGKIALCKDTIAVGGPADTVVVDFVGYGSANLFEGSAPAAAPGNTASIERKAVAGSDAGSMSGGGADERSGNGWDSDDNSDDFIRRSPDPQNSASETETPGGTLNVLAVYGDKWNLVSLPLAVADPAAARIFPGALTPLYGYTGGYLEETTAVLGAGYWMKFAGPETVTFAGRAVDPDTISLDPGWNLVGSGAVPMSVERLRQIPEGNIAGGFYEYDEGYRPADSLRPGRAYWVRSTTGGSLVLDSRSPLPGAELWPALTPVGTIRVVDGSGGDQSFTVRLETGTSTPWIDSDLPPPPPDGAFDVRLVPDPGGRVYALRIRSARPPVTIAWDFDALPAPGMEISVGGGGWRTVKRPVSSGSEVLPPVADQVVRFRISVANTDVAGPLFTGVCPNPFNPSTTIRFFMPSAGHVGIDIADMLGRHVASLVSGFRDAGPHSVEWDARGKDGSPVSGGVYLIFLKSGGMSTVRKVLYLK